MQTAQIIPFRFETCEVRTFLVDDQPWFVAADVSSALEYRIAGDMTRNLDDDEKGTQIVRTPGGSQEMLVINESGLYSAILRSRKAEAKRFKKWVTAEVLPAIRKHGRYEDGEGKMITLVGKTIGTDGFHMLGAVVKGKVSSLPAAIQRRATAKIWSQAHAAFGVRSAADIPADQLDSARNFIAAYALEGEWLPRVEQKRGVFVLDQYQAQNLHNLLHYTDWVVYRWGQGIGDAMKLLNPSFHSNTWEFFQEAGRAASRLERGLPELMSHFRNSGDRGLRPSECEIAGVATGSPAG